MILSNPNRSLAILIRRIVKVAQEMFAKWVNGDKSAVHPDLRSAVFGIAIKNGGKKEALLPTKTMTNGTVGSGV